MSNSVSDAEIIFLARENTLLTNTASIAGFRRRYLNIRLGLDPKDSGSSITDKEIAYLKIKTGLTTGSLADLRAVYWATVVGANKGVGGDAALAYFTNAPAGN